MVFLSPNSICLPSHLNTLARLVFQNHHTDLTTPYSETKSSTSTLFESKLTKILYLTLHVLHADPIQSHILVLHNTDLPNFQVRAVYLQYIHQGFFYPIFICLYLFPRKVRKLPAPNSISSVRLLLIFLCSLYYMYVNHKLLLH